MMSDSLKPVGTRRALLRFLAIVAMATAGLSIPSLQAGAAATLVRPSALAAGSAPSGATPLGAVPQSQQIQLSIVLPPSNKSGLQTLLKNLYDPKSPEYHQWLQPGEFAQQFGPSSSEIAAVVTWLHSSGLTQTTVSGFTVSVSASTAQVSASLGTSFERYRTSSGHVGYLAQQAPKVPQSLANGQVTAILGLNTVSTLHSQGSLAPVAQAQGAGVARPAADGLTACTAAQNAAGPGEFTMDVLGSEYGIGSLLANGQNGSGVTAAVFELAPHSATDVTTYQGCFGLTNSVTTQTVSTGGTVNASGTAEADADIEQIATQAPGASIISYEGPNTFNGQYDTWSAIVTADAAEVISTSWGYCEGGKGGAEQSGMISSDTTLFEQAATQGQTVLAAAGDSGSEGCYVPANSSPTALGVGYPASDPSVTTVGGTDLTSPGVETAWNFCLNTESTDCANYYNGYVAGGGGLSGYLSRPSWQPNVLTPGTSQACGLGLHPCRQVPDVSANAGAGMVIYENGSWAPWIGTSLAAPFWAGLVADRNVGCTAPTGLLAPALYGLAAQQGAYGNALTDITSGNTDMTGTNGGAYQALTGYDGATGLGSPLASGLSCPEVTSAQAGSIGSQVTISGLGLESSTISFGATAVQVVSSSATSATVVVPSGHGTVTVSATSLLGTGTQVSSFTYPTPLPYTSVNPTRICDTRPDQTGVVTNQCNNSGAGGTLGAAGTMNVTVTGGDVPTSATAVILNVAVTGTSASSFLSVYPTGTTRTAASNLNWTPGTTIPNLVEVPVGTNGQVSVYNLAGSADVIIDIEGYVGPSTVTGSGLYNPMTPARICDTRVVQTGVVANQCNNNGVGTGTLGPATTKNITVDGLGGVPATGVSAVALNVAVTGTTSSGFLSVYPGLTPMTSASNLNWTPGETIPNRVVVPVGSDGTINLYNAFGNADVIVDVSGWYSNGNQQTTGSLYVPISPTRICDTRVVQTGVIANQCNNNGAGTLGPGATKDVAVTPYATVPPGATAAVLNVAVTGTTASSFMSVWPEGVTRPTASDLNWVAGETIPNLVIATLPTTGSGAGDVSLYNLAGNADAIVDVEGYYVLPPG